MSREDIVTIRVKGGGALNFSHGVSHSLKLGAGETADKWLDGSPITRGEFEDVISAHAPVEIVEKPAQEKAPKEKAK